MATFKKFTIAEFEQFINDTKIARTVLFIQQHHTYIPSYVHFTGNNHIGLQTSMRNTHVNHNGWSAIGQHFTTFPDGTIVSGRSLEQSPAGIFGNNANAICIENLGNFDTGKDIMTDAQKNTIIRMTAALCKKFSLAVDTDKIVYHHWFNLATGARNNGNGNNKSCPGTNFFGGNKVIDCQTHFLPLVQSIINGIVTPTNVSPQIDVLKYVCVTTASLNIRTGNSADYPKAIDRNAAKLGAILRVYEQKGDWYKVSSSAQHWVYGKFCKEVQRAIVNTDTLNVRNGAGTEYDKIASLSKGQEVFIVEKKTEWSKISMDERWVKNNYLDFY